MGHDPPAIQMTISLFAHVSQVISEKIQKEDVLQIGNQSMAVLMMLNVGLDTFVNQQNVLRAVEVTITVHQSKLVLEEGVKMCVPSQEYAESMPNA